MLWSQESLPFFIDSDGASQNSQSLPMKDAVQLQGRFQDRYFGLALMCTGILKTRYILTCFYTNVIMKFYTYF